jgi:outer membrane biosynthesis protein TonB
MEELRFAVYCEKQPPSTGTSDVIIRREPTPPANPNPPLEPTKKMVDPPTEQPKR